MSAINELVEICRHETHGYWRQISNPDFESPFSEGLAAQLMRNEANKYVEYKNCGVIYRIIRKKDLVDYIPE